MQASALAQSEGPSDQTVLVKSSLGADMLGEGLALTCPVIHVAVLPITPRVWIGVNPPLVAEDVLGPKSTGAMPIGS